MGNGFIKFRGKGKQNSGRKVRYRDNRGSTLVIVIVALAMLGILSSIILYTTYINFRMKVTEAKATDNFYTGETAMEEIKAGLEKEVSDAFSGAYLAIMQNYDAYDEVGRITQFQYLYLQRLQEVLQDPADATTFNKEKMESYITDPARAELADASVDSLVKYTDSIQLKGLRITYTDANGYVAVISTDIVLKIPNVRFDSMNSIPDMLTYSMIADDTLELTDVGISEISGSVYGGGNGIIVSNGVDVIFSDAETLVTGGNVYVTGSGSSFTVDDRSSLWADGIYVDSASLSLRGNTYVQDDLTVNGRGSDVLLAGAYYGYGYRSVATTDYGPAGSSSILINGADTDLNMADLNRLVLAGQAYVGTKDRDTDGDGVIGENDMNMGQLELDGTIYDSALNEDVRMGQSFAVKSDQLAYLVPAQCIGIVNGESYLGSNPVNLKDYNEFKKLEAEGSDTCVEVELSMIAGNLSRPLSDYGASWQKVFYQSSGASNAWVYYYLKFGSADQANRFFQDYFNANAEFLTSYMNNYLSSFTAPESFGRLNLAGNLVMYDVSAGEYSLQPSTTTNDAVTEYTLLSEYDEYRSIYQALQVNLSRNYGTLTDAQKAKSVFYNVIDVEKLRDYIYQGGNVTPSKTVSENDMQIILVDNDHDDDGVSETVYTIPSDSKIKVVIATGDVIVNTDFTGLIISGGTITVQNGANITADPDGVSIALQADHYNVLKCFVEGESLTGELEEPVETPVEDEAITTESLVSYRNWNKQ